MQGIKHTTRCRGQNAFISLCGTARLGHLKLLQLQQPSSTWGCLSFYMCLCCSASVAVVVVFVFVVAAVAFAAFQLLALLCLILSPSRTFFVCVCVCVCSCCYLLLFAVSFAQELVNNFIIACGAVQHHQAATPLKYPARSRPLSVSH